MTRVAFSMNGNRAGMVHPQKTANSCSCSCLPCQFIRRRKQKARRSPLVGPSERHCSSSGSRACRHIFVSADKLYHAAKRDGNVVETRTCGPVGHGKRAALRRPSPLLVKLMIERVLASSDRWHRW